MTKNNERIWVVEFLGQNEDYYPDINSVFHSRDEARYYARLCKSAGDKVRLRKYVRESVDG
jgi:hypothetical protein